jgi:hypothetical protein
MTDARPVSDLIAEARPAERSVELCLRADLVAEVEDLRRQLATAKAATRQSLADAPAAGIEERIAAVKTQMAESTITVVLRAVPRRRWLRLINEHPPRDGDHADKNIGVNTATFFDAAIRACWVSPTISTDDLATLLGDESRDGALSAAQFDQLAEAAWTVNARATNVPFGWRASPSTQG